ncbi:class I adenylate-forming enzyme family protein [Evansella halocellulosilytica]|uniref:class I adenylate-forming enzyme family protein n=1 Tax=Evansella halocellulosilytica TaxID=2011013 RepID=UPI000BB81BA6|nr:AMP-binding protein [Evansella halocellulosilytica]
MRIPIHELLRQHAKETPNKKAIVYYGNAITYKELDLYSDRFAAFLQNKGIEKGDRVALFLQNSPQYIIAHFGIQKIGAIVGPCNPMFKEWELEYQLNDLTAKAIVLANDLYPIYEKIKHSTSVREVFLTSYFDFLPDELHIPFPEKVEPFVKIESCWSFKSIVHNDSLHTPQKVDINMEEDVSLVVYTSGTTGAPKGAMLTFNNASFKTECLVKTYDFSPDDVHLSIMPIFHIAGMLVGLNGPIMTGGTIILLTRFAPNAALSAINHYEVTVAYTTPPMNVEMMKHPLCKVTQFEHLRANLATSFGLPVTEEISNQWKEVSGVELFEFAYGMSETHTGDALMPKDRIRFGTVGMPTYETQIKIVSLENQNIELPQGELGEIAIKSPSVFKGYLDKPEETNKDLQDGWFYTGDMGKFDQDGYLHFTGRAKEMIKCSGYSVFPEEVEKMLIRHDAISKAAVIGVPDHKRGESVKAFVVLDEEYKNKITPEDIISWSKEKMAAYKYPRYVELVDSLPQTTSGKLLRRLLKTQ